jgi:hypothetical protein
MGMRLIFAILLLLIRIGVADAATLEWSGYITTPFGGGPPLVVTGTGVATISTTVVHGVEYIDGIRLGTGLQGTATLPVTDPMSPTLQTVRLTGGIEGNDLFTLENREIPVRGQLKMCIFFPGCAFYLPIPLTASSGSVGIGIGGMITINGKARGAGPKMSVQAAPWTVGVVTITNETENGVNTYTVKGIVSPIGATAELNGQIQLVTSMVVKSSGSLYEREYPLTLRVRFVPEPGMLLLLTSGTAGLMLLGWCRHE